MTTSTRLTLAQIFANVSAAKDAERSNETAFISELMAHAGNTQNVRNISYYLNAMSVKQLGSMAVYRDFLNKFTNFEILFADSNTKVFSNGDIVAKDHADYANAQDYKTWFRSQLTDAGLNDDAQSVLSSIIYVCKGFKAKPKNAKPEATDAVREAREQAQGEWEFRKELWAKFCRGEAIDVIVAHDAVNLTDGKPTPVSVQVTDYGSSITAFMSRLATLTRSAKLAMTKATKSPEDVLKAAKKKVSDALAALAKLEGGEEAIREVIAAQVANEIGEGMFAVYSRTAQGGLTIPVICTRTEEGHYVQVENNEE